MTHASEGQHFYRPNGEPCYQVPAKSGAMRPATLRDARKMGLYFGVSTVIKCASAPALEVWKQNQVLLAALTLPRLPGESDESFCKRIVTDSQEQSRKARDRGSEIHAAIQGHYEGAPPSEELWPFVKGAVDVIAANCQSGGWVAEKSFAHTLGFGGKCDVHNPYWVLDFKTKEFTAEVAPTLKTWDDHAMQLTSYREGLRVPGARCGIVYVSTTTPGLARLIEIDEADLDRGWTMFRGLLQFCKAKTGYYPELWKEAEAT